MKLMRIGETGAEVPAVLAGDGILRDLRPLTADIDGAFLGRLAEVDAALDAGLLPPCPESLLSARVGAPVARPGKIICIGVNYRGHAQETAHAIPTEPVVFLKTSQTMVGPNDTVLIPRLSSQTDWEVELAVVIGRRAHYLAGTDEAMACVAGYAISHDVSEREFQLARGGTWDKGKNCDTFNPLGPWLVTADAVPDPQALDLRLAVNGEVRQSGNTADMIFGVAEIVRYLSQFMVLEPGDVINTGTPPGCALGYPDPKPYLRAGDVVELAIDSLGSQRQVMGQA
ncbi:MAG: 2-hydroxyhepta-2,4-diene,7-dioate isomerase [Frankiales bacterium]|nr:2-hydroxyhepta-2,4-diene,7-dioate isomerase [Frankiales bacterium]